MEHTPNITPLPWKAYKTLGGIIQIANDNKGQFRVGTLMDSPHMEANAAYIVTACNHHEELVGILRDLQSEGLRVKRMTYERARAILQRIEKGE